MASGRSRFLPRQEVNCAGHQSRRKTVDAKVLTPKYDVANSGIVRQHADDDRTIEQLGDIRRGLETERRELVHLVGATNIRDHPKSGGGKVCGHRRSHVTKTDKADFTLHRRLGI